MSINPANILLGAIRGAVREVIQLPTNAAPAAQAPVIAEQVVQEVRQTPAVQDAIAQIEHATNSEPWYKSRVTLGALVSMVTAAGGLFGVSVSPEDADLVVAVCMAAGTAAGGVLTLYGRWVAKKPLGE